MITKKQCSYCKTHLKEDDSKLFICHICKRSLCHSCYNIAHGAVLAHTTQYKNRTIAYPDILCPYCIPIWEYKHLSNTKGEDLPLLVNVEWMNDEVASVYKICLKNNMSLLDLTTYLENIYLSDISAQEKDTPISNLTVSLKEMHLEGIYNYLEKKGLLPTAEN